MFEFDPFVISHLVDSVGSHEAVTVHRAAPLLLGTPWYLATASCWRGAAAYGWRPMADGDAVEPMFSASAAACSKAASMHVDGNQLLSNGN